MKDVYILLPPLFNENAVLQPACQFRQAGIKVSLIGWSSPSVRGCHGIRITPDLRLDQLNGTQESSTCCMVLCSLKDSSAIAWLSDPRIYQLFKKVISSGGHIAFFANNLPKLVRESAAYKALKPQGILIQGTRSAGEFTRLLQGTVENGS